jgi:NADH-quinone oxidoreductase subunit N
MVGIGFKVAAVPFHFWTPDVYEGAPTPVTAFVSTASKAAGFGMLIRMFLAGFATSDSWLPMLIAMAAVTMTLGNLVALAQRNIKRLLAYSSVAHSGYALVAFVALSDLGVAATLFYLMTYVLTNLAAFAIVILFARAAGSDEIADYAGLSRRSPYLALAMLVAFLSLAGMPPLAGFFGKVYVFAAAVKSGLIWLAFLGVLNAIVGLYYYLVVLKVVYIHPAPEGVGRIEVPTAYRFALGVLVFGILLLGTASGPWFDWALRAAQGWL